MAGVMCAAALTACGGGSSGGGGAAPTPSFAAVATPTVSPTDQFWQALGTQRLGKKVLTQYPQHLAVGLGHSVCKSWRAGAGRVMIAQVLMGTNLHPTARQAGAFVTLSHKYLCPNA